MTKKAKDPLWILEELDTATDAEIDQWFDFVEKEHPEVYENLKQEMLAPREAAQFTPDGFAVFYKYAVPQYELPPYAYNPEWKPEEQLMEEYGDAYDKDLHYVDSWVHELMFAIENEQWALIEAFRGAHKSTTLAAWCAWFMGLNPTRTNIIVGAGSNDAEDVANQIADVIMSNAFFRKCFPNVVPMRKGWIPNDAKKEGRWGSDKGYDIWDTNVEYNHWVGQVAAFEGRAPSLIGVGYNSTFIPGPHPTGFLLIDDYHDTKNTKHAKILRTSVEEIYAGEIVPMADISMLHAIIGTPWVRNDIISHAKSTGEFRSAWTPVRKTIKGEVRPVWPEAKNDEWIQRMERRIKNPVQIARMLYLDIKAMEGLVLKGEWWEYFEYVDLYPDKVNGVYIGVDYTSTKNPLSDTTDYFGLLVGLDLVGERGIVLVDGDRVRLSHYEAQETVIDFIKKYRRYGYVRVGIEAIREGNLFYQDLLDNSYIKAARGEGVSIRPVRFSDDKHFRYWTKLAPIVQSGNVKLSTADHSVLDDLLQEWLNWRGNEWEKDFHNDLLDALYAMIVVSTYKVSPMTQREEFTEPGEEDRLMQKVKRRFHHPAYDGFRRDK